jgi:hypothetical protein
MNIDETMATIKDAAEAATYLKSLRMLELTNQFTIINPISHDRPLTDNVTQQTETLIQFDISRHCNLTPASTCHPLTEEEADTINRIAAAVLKRQIEAAEAKARAAIAAVKVSE